MKVSSTFKIRRYWFDPDTPKEVLDTLNFRYGDYPDKIFRRQLHLRYVDVNYWGDSDKNLTIMELKYGDWIINREELEYTVEGDDGLD